MPLYIKLQNGVGYLERNSDDSPAAAELVGWIDFVVDPRDGSVCERHALKAWIKRRGEPEPWFALSCRGWTGELRKQPDEPNAGGQKFVGHLGPNEELSVSACVHVDDDGKPCLRLEVRDADVSLETKTPDSDDLRGLDPDLKTLVF